MRTTQASVIAFSFFSAITGSSCVEDEGSNGTIESEYYLESGATVLGSIVVDESIGQLTDGAGTICVGLYDPEQNCPPSAEPFTRHVGLFYRDMDIDTEGSVSFVIHNVLPGRYALGALFDADQSGCYSDLTSGDSMTSQCLEFAVQANETIELEPLPINLELP